MEIDVEKLIVTLADELSKSHRYWGVGKEKALMALREEADRMLRYSEWARVNSQDFSRNDWLAFCSRLRYHGYSRGDARALEVMADHNKRVRGEPNEIPHFDPPEEKKVEVPEYSFEVLVRQFLR